MNLNPTYQEKVFDFLQRLSKTRAFNIDELSSWLKELFEFENLVIFYYNDSILTGNDKMTYARKPYSGMSHYLNGMKTLSDHEENDIVQQFLKHYTNEDFMDISNLPPHLRNNDVVLTSDLAPEFLSLSDYYHFLKERKLSNILCLYIRDRDQNCIARIATLKSDDDPPFSDQEIWAMQAIGPFISIKIDNSIYTQLKLKTGRLLQSAASKMDSGLIILNRHMIIRYCNPAAETLCEEISSICLSAEQQDSPRLHSGSTIDNVIRHLFIRYHQGNQIHTSFQSERYEYSCTLRTETFTEPDRPAVFYYYIYIIKQMRKRADDSFDHIIKQYALTKREADVLELIVQGYDNQRICQTLFISMNTVKTHISNIYKKTDVSSRPELIFLINRIK